jgi:hypothetical protein
LPAHHIEQSRAIAARLGRTRQIGDGFKGLRQLAPHDARGCQPEHHLKVFRRFSEPLAQLAGAREDRHSFACRRPVRGDEARPQDQLEIELGPLLASTRRQSACHFDASLQVCDGLEIGRAQGGILTGL